VYDIQRVEFSHTVISISNLSAGAHEQYSSANDGVTFYTEAAFYNTTLTLKVGHTWSFC